MANVKAIAEALVNISSEDIAKLAEELRDEDASATPKGKSASKRANFKKRIPRRKRQKK